MGDRNDDDEDSSSNSYRFSSSMAEKKRPRRLKIKQYLGPAPTVDDDDDDDAGGGGSSSAAIPPPAGPMQSPKKPSASVAAGVAAITRAVDTPSSSPSPGLVASDSSSSGSSASSPKRVPIRRAGRKPAPPQQQEKAERVGRTPIKKQSPDESSEPYDMHAPTMYDSYRRRSRSRSQGASPDRDDELKAAKGSPNSLGNDPNNSMVSVDSSTGWSSRDSGSESYSESQDETSEEDEMYTKYRKYLSKSDEEEDADAPWRKKSKANESQKKLGAPPTLEYSYQAQQQQLAAPLTEAADKEKQKSPPKQRLTSDKLPKEDLKTIGKMLLLDDSSHADSSHQDESSTDGGNASDHHHVFVDPTSTDEDEPVLYDRDEDASIGEKNVMAPIESSSSESASFDANASDVTEEDVLGDDVPVQRKTPEQPRRRPENQTRIQIDSSRYRKTEVPLDESSNRAPSSRRSHSSGSSGSDSNFSISVGSSDSERGRDDRLEERKPPAAAIAAGVVVAAAIADPEQPPESKQPPTQSHQPKKEEPVRKIPSIDVSESEGAESIDGDESEIWEKMVLNENKTKGLNSSSKSSLSSKRGGRDSSLSQSEKSFGDSLSLPRETVSDRPPKRLLSEKRDIGGDSSLLQSLGSSWGETGLNEDESVEDSAPIPPMSNRSSASSARKDNLIDSSLHVQDLQTSNKSLSASESEVGSGSLEIGGVMAMLGAAGGDDDEFSLKPSQDLERLEEVSENSEYDHKKSKQDYVSDEFMNQGLQDLDTSISTHDVETPASERKVSFNSASSSSSSYTESTASKKELKERQPARRDSAVPKWLVWGVVVLLFLAAIGIPLYFLVFDESNNSTTTPAPIPPLFPSLAPVAPTPQPPTDPPAQNPAPSLPPNPSPTRPTIPPITASPITTPSLPPALAPVPPPSAAEDLRDFLISEWPSLEDDLVGFNTPQYFAYDWLLNDPGLPLYSERRILQRFSLATLYFSTDGDNWRRNDRWLSNENECLWYSASGVLPCDDNLAYTFLNLPLNGMVGTIPSELALLSNSLTRIDFSSRDGGGTLSGSIPNELGFLSLLELVDLSGNQLQGSLPPGMGKWNKVLTIDLRDNQLWGSLPFSIIHWASLLTLDVGNNALESSLPTSIGTLSNLRSLDLSGNSLTGPIPSEIGDLRRLHTLYLQENRFTSNLPSEVGNLLMLEQFSAHKNNIDGPIPNEIGSLVNLLTLNLSQNSLSGSLPPGIGSLFSLRDELNLSDNQITGPLPEELGRLIFMRNLLLQSNALTGPVPTTFANLNRLEVLRLEDNALTGEVPDEVCAVYSETYPIFVTDCLDGEIVCDCCMFCCSDSGGCECQYAGTDLSFLCFEFTKSPGLEQRIFGNIM